jgi:hypothetical protein
VPDLDGDGTPDRWATSWAEVVRTVPLPLIVVCQVLTTLRVFELI